MKKTILILMAALACAGCAVVNRSSTAKDGRANKTTAWTLLSTLDGLDDSMTAGGTSRTKITKLTGDVQMVQALTEFAKVMAVLSRSGTNNDWITNLFSGQ